MGGTMEYGRMRHRNGLAERKPLDDSDPYPRNMPPREMDLRLLVGDLNRMERDLLGLGPFGDLIIDQARRVTGLSKPSILKVLRWVLDWPEPGCETCKEPHEPWPRCNAHKYGLGW